MTKGKKTIEFFSDLIHRAGIWKNMQGLDMQISQINLFHVYWLLFILAIWVIISKHQTCNLNYSIFTITKLL